MNFQQMSHQQELTFKWKWNQDAKMIVTINFESYCNHICKNNHYYYYSFIFFFPILHNPNFCWNLRRHKVCWIVVIMAQLKQRPSYSTSMECDKSTLQLAQPDSWFLGWNVLDGRLSNPKLELCLSLSKHTWPLNWFPGARFKPATPWPDPTILCCSHLWCPPSPL